MTGSGASPDIFALTNGNYLVSSANWDNGIVDAVGAVTWGNGTTGIAARSRPPTAWSVAHPPTRRQRVEHYPLSNGNYVVRSSNWDEGAPRSER